MNSAEERKRIFREQLQKTQQQKFYVGFEDSGFITSVVSSTDQLTTKYCEISKELAEGFLSGTINKDTYIALPIGDGWEIVKKEQQKNVAEVSRNFYKVEEKQDKVQLVINVQDSTLTLEVDRSVDKSTLRSYGLYVCDKNCFHTLHQSIVLDPERRVYPLTKVDDIDIYAGAHAVGLGITYV